MCGSVGLFCGAPFNWFICLKLCIVDALANAVNVVQKPVARPTDAAPKRSLNLEDYKKKRGLI